MAVGAGAAERKLVYSSPTPRGVLRPLKQPLYDTENLPSAGGVAQFIFFQRPIGQAMTNAPAAAKSIADTNMQQAAQLGTPLEFDLYGFNFRLGMGTLTLADFRVVMDQGVFVFAQGQGRVFLRTQLQDIPSGVAPSGGVSIDGAGALTPNDLPIQGVPSVKEMYNFTIEKKPIRIRSNENFSVEVQYPNAAPNPALFVRMTVLMRGILYTSL